MTKPILLKDPCSLSLPALFLKFLRFGVLAFGGPVAQIAMLRQALVDEERWINPVRFNRLLAVLQVLPGPEAHELCVHLGMIARGRLGGLLAGLAFMLPGFVLMLAVGWLYANWIAGNDGLTGLLLGIQVVVLAIILRAVARISSHILEDRLLWFIAGLSLVTTLMSVPFWIPLAMGGVVYAAFQRWMRLVILVVIGLLVAALTARFGGTGMGAATPTAGPASLGALFIAGLKGGLLTFGGAYTAIPYVRADTVGRDWISDATFLDGVAIAGVLPAPLVIFATFVGYVVSGLSGALAITAGMFLPAFAFSLILFERLEALVDNPALHRVLAGVAAAVVGIIGATFLQLGKATVERATILPVAFLLFLIAALIAWRVRGTWVTPAIVAGGGLAGYLIWS